MVVAAALFGVLISASYYVIRPLDSQGRYSNSVPPLMWPVYLLSLLNVVPRIFVARVVWEALGMPAWLGEALFASYWPCLGAFAGSRKHWVLWAVGVLAVNAGLLALFLYALSRVRLTF